MGALRPLGDFSEASDLAEDEPERPQPSVLLGCRGGAQQRPARSPTGWSTASGASSRRCGRPDSSRTFRPGGGPVTDESVPLLWGGFRHDRRHRDRTATGRRRRLRVGRLVRRLCALPGRRDGPLHLRPGRRRAGASRRRAWRRAATHRRVLRRRRGGGPGRMVLLVDGAEVDEIDVEGILPMAAPARRRRPPPRLRQRFPRLGPLRAAGPLHGHGAREYGSTRPASLRPDPADEVRAALHAD